MKRIQQLNQQLITQNQLKGSRYATMEFAQRPKRKLDYFNEYGWGYSDTKFADHPEGYTYVTGTRYREANKKLVTFRNWAETIIGIDVNKAYKSQEECPVDEPIINQEFIDSLKEKVDEVTMEKHERLLHSHGQTLEDMYQLRHGKLARYVDYVIFVTSHEQCEFLVKQAVKYNIVLIPFGGGSNVTNALNPDKKETRPIASVDVTRMNSIKWVDKKSMTACVESGIVGVELEKELHKYGVMCGMEPDSVEFSTVGGWVATRASGMKKNRYGNIEDIVLSIKLITPTGIIQKVQIDNPRMSAGPNINEFIIGSEGILGLITEVVIKLKEIPEVVEFDSILFPDYENGINFMYEVARSKAWPASMRLVDNQQFIFGLNLKTEDQVKKGPMAIVDWAQKFFITKIMNYDPNKMCLCTILFEGSEKEVKYQQSVIYQISKSYNGFSGGSENGKRGYFLTFMIGYIRDYGLNYGFFAESFETSVNWKNVGKLIQNVGKRIEDECSKRGIKKKPFVTSRVTQIYDSGACVYIYMGFLKEGLKDPLKSYEEIEAAARDEIIKSGGSISHHHGVGKLRKQFMARSIGDEGINMLKGVKEKIDPQNIFGANNLF